MASASIGQQNVGRIAERIIANELEFRGFRVSDLNKEGTSANADLIAAKSGKTWQIQVKGASFERGYADGWWFSYGYCDEQIIRDRSLPMFNRKKAFYRADVVAMVCVKSPSEYKCLIMPAKEAEKAAQMNLDYAYRTKKKDGSDKKPNKVWVGCRYIPARTREAGKRDLMKAEQDFLEPYLENWGLELFPAASAEGS
jgi:hypothetical protein